MSNPSRPVIGLTLDSEEPGGYSKFPWYALRRNYAGSVAAVGGLPFPLPHEIDCVEGFLARLDGLIVTGGAFDVDPGLFGESTRHASVSLKEGRTAFELAILRGALERDMPVLGICGGEQLLNVVLGGTLIQHIPDEIDEPLPHEQPNPRDEAGHEVELVEGTQLARLCGARRIAVNSAHHQAVKTAGPGILVNAHADDGVIEGIEDPSKRFCIGVEWHPEFFISPADRRLMEGFLAAAEGYRSEKADT